MSRESAQAGNRASKTGHCLQWWENKPEWCAVSSGVTSKCNAAFLGLAAACELGLAALLHGGYTTLEAHNPVASESDSQQQAQISMSALIYELFVAGKCP